MTEYTHSDDFEYKGVWWLPEKPDKRVAGTVSFDSEGVNLQLFGLLHESGDYKRRDLQPGFILGRAEGKLITLYQTFETQSTMPPEANIQSERPELYISTFLANYMFVGAHFTSESEVVFTSIDVDFTYMEEWMGLERIPFETDAQGGRHTVSYSFPEAIEIRVQEIKSRISISSSFTRGGDTFSSLNWEHNALILISPDKQKDFEWYQTALHDCQNLFTLLIGRPVHPKQITAHVEGEFKDINYGNMQGPVEIFSYEYSRSVRRNARALLSRWHWRDVLVPLSSIETNLEQVFNAWFHKANLLRPVYTLFFSTVYNSDIYLEYEFLALAQALESYHSRISLDGSDRYFPEEKYAGYQEAMLSALPKDVIETLSLKQRLKYFNRYTLKKRLDELLENIGYPIRMILTDDPGRFARKVTDTRNYLTHYGEELRVRALEKDEFYNVNQKLQVWLMALLLLELNIDYQTILTATEGFRKLYFAREG